MRPRVFPAEDVRLAGPPRPGRPAASMRPRVFPAEDGRRHSGGACRRCFNEAAGIPRGRPARRPVVVDSAAGPRFNEAAGIPRGRRPADHQAPELALASMRPRVFPAEDGDHALLGRRRLGASMRPRVFPAEDPRAGAPTGPGTAGFNEAAGIPRGRPAAGPCHCLPIAASMRPRVFPAEDAGTPRTTTGAVLGFNEAAGIPRGRPGSCAAPHHCIPDASMRPRVFPAEDALGGSGSGGGLARLQ